MIRSRARIRAGCAVLLLALAGTPASGRAQGSGGQARQDAPATGLTLERIFGGDLAAVPVDLQWTPDGSAWTTVERDVEDRDELWRIDARSGERRKLISAAELNPGGEGQLRISGHAFSRDGGRVLLFTGAERVWRDRTKGTYYVFDFVTRRLLPVSRAAGFQMFAKFSPDGRRVAFVRDNDLWLSEPDSGEERRLTTDGSETVVNGTTDWVYEEELGLRDAFRWSPDGRRIAFWRLDQSPVPVYYLVDEMPDYPRLRPMRYPEAGRPNSRVRVGSLDVETGGVVWFDLGTDPEVYVPRMDWAASSEEIAIQRLDRSQKRLDVLMGDAATGATRLLFSERDDAWVDVVDGPTWVDRGSRFLWLSERDGWRHLYLYDRSGRLLRQLTWGDWDVTRLVGVDDADGRVVVQAASESPVSRALLAVALDSAADPLLLGGGRGWRDASLSPDGSLYLESRSEIAAPPVWTLREAADGSTVRVVQANDALVSELAGLGLREPEFLTVRAEDGTPLNAWMIKPTDFDPARSYPLLLYVYGGPGSQQVVDRWGAGRPDRYLWHQWVAGKGVVVACVDNRGTGARGRDFRKQVNLRLGDLETQDQLAAVAQLGELPYVDATRVGIWGWSYGGTMALLTTFLGEGSVTAGAAVAPVTAWELYDTIYTERYMGTPEQNPEAYRRADPITWAEQLSVPVLVVHGTGDDNVHPQNTLRLARALTEAGRPFAMHLYPNRTHALEGTETRIDLFRRLGAFFLAHLGTSPVEPVPRRGAPPAPFPLDGGLGPP